MNTRVVSRRRGHKVHTCIVLVDVQGSLKFEIALPQCNMHDFNQQGDDSYASKMKQSC